MTASNNTRQWGWISQSLHWIVALLVFANMALGWLAQDMALSPQKLKVFLWHKSIGLTVLALSLVRLAWRLSQRTPQPIGTIAPWQRRSAIVTHLALYFLLFALPVSGWLLNSAANVPLRWYGLIEVPALIAASKPLAQTLISLHHLLFWILLTLLLVHIAASLKHHFIDRDEVLSRMLPGNRKGR